jgi:hypothetical protein
MASADALLLRPVPGGDYRARSKFRAVGLGAALFGVVAAMIALVANIVAGLWVDQPARATQVARIDAWSFGLNTAAFGVVKLAIAIVLLGILRQLWLRVESVKTALPSLKGSGDGPVPIHTGPVNTRWGKAKETTTVPKPLVIHRMARAMWAPSAAMGFMAVMAGLVLAIVQAGNVVSDPTLAGHLSAWVRGIQFLGEGFLLSGISFILGSILSSLRTGGGEVQEALGVSVKTLDMPTTANAFVGLMMVGLMVEVFQFVVYLATTTFTPATAATYFTWLGPVREAGLGLILSGIVLALVTIGNVLGFQFARITEIVRTGR